MTDLIQLQCTDFNSSILGINSIYVNKERKNERKKEKKKGRKKEHTPPPQN